MSKRSLPTMLLLAACSGPEPTPAEPSPTEAVLPAPVEAAPEIPDFPGVVTARNTRVVVAEFRGNVNRIQVAQGQRVRAGDPIAQLDDTELRSQIEAARHNERASRAEAGAAGVQAFAASRAYKRDAALVRKGYVARSTVDNSYAQSASLGQQSGAHASRADSYKAERERLEDLVAKAQMTSPIDGIVVAVNVKAGAMAERGTQLVRIFDPKDLILKFAVPREHRKQLAPGKRVELRIDGAPRTVWATIERIADEEPPITFAVVEADLDDSKLAPDEIAVSARGRVRIAEAAPAAGGKR